MDPDQTASTGASDLAPHCLSMRLKIFSGRQKKHTFCDFVL